MGQMQITVSDCKKFNTTFKWECDGEQLQNTVEFIQEVANQSGIAPDAFCRNALVHLP